MFPKVIILSMMVLSFQTAQAQTSLKGSYVLSSNDCSPNVPVGTEVKAVVTGLRLQVFALVPITASNPAPGTMGVGGKQVISLVDGEVGHDYRHSLGSGASFSDTTFVNALKFVSFYMIQRLNGDFFELVSKTTFLRSEHEAKLIFENGLGESRTCVMI